jgi:hypothetical protein
MIELLPSVENVQVLLQARRLEAELEGGQARRAERPGPLSFQPAAPQHPQTREISSRGRILTCR